MKLLEIRSISDFHKAIWKGDIKEIKFNSSLLKGNIFLDPIEKTHIAYIPRSAVNKKNLPIIYGLPTYGRNALHFFVPERVDKESIVSRINKLLGQGMPDFIFVALDCMTSLGGNQYTNGASGNFADYIIKEAIPQVEDVLGKSLSIGNRGILGTSSGGYGALYLSLHYPNHFSAVACHSGDMGFDYSYIPEIPLLINRLDHTLPDDDSKIAELIERYRRNKIHTPSIMHDLVLLGAASSYSPDEKSKVGFVLPFDLFTGELVESVWEKWKEKDLVTLSYKLKDSYKIIKKVFIDCGNRDQYGLHLGARQLSAQLKKLKIDHIYDEFDGTHTDIEYRYETSLPILVNSLLD